jgi:FKBP-type peptidyl-prolyl cis-trans isomerase FkpA
MTTRNKSTLALTLVALLAAAQGCTKGCGTSENAKQENTGSEQNSAAQQQQNPNAAGMTTPPGGGMQLKSEDLKVGTGAEATTGKTVSVHYTGWLTDGKEFDSSIKRGTPFEFRLGEGGVIQGWDKGVVGMKVGGKRKLTIPPEMAYGERGAGNGLIPPNSTLVFEIELKAVN